MKEFDGSVIEVVDSFKGTSEPKKKTTLRNYLISVVAYNKDLGQLGIDVLKIDTT